MAFRNLDKKVFWLALLTSQLFSILAQGCTFLQLGCCWLDHVNSMHIRTYFVCVDVPKLKLMGDISTPDDFVVVTWENASSPYCGEVLFYIVMIESDVHTDIPNNIINHTDLTVLMVTFSSLMNNTKYTVSITPFNLIGKGPTVSDTVTLEIQG